MVLQKRLDYGFNGYQVPPTPRAARSARRRRCFKKGSEDNQILPFDLLAIVAGKLLLEKDSSTSSGAISANKDQLAVASDNAKNKWEDKGKPLEVEAQDNESPASNFLVSKLASQVQAQNSSSEENDMKLGLVAAITNSDCMESFNAEQLVNRRGKDDMRTPNSKVEVALSSYKECGDYCKLKDQTTRLIKDESHRPANVLNNSEAVTCYSDDLWLCNRKPALVSLHCSAKVPLRGNNLIPNTSCPVIQDNVNISSRDDDENSSGCTHPSTTKKFFRSAPCIGDRRIRKILASKYWKVAPKLKDATLSKIDGNRRSAYFRRKNSYKYQSSEKLYPFKKRKYFGYNSPSNSDGGISSEICLDSPRLGNSGDASGFFQKMHGATGPSVVDQNTSFQPRDPHVKLRIKSFRVPELFIEIPESGTIGSLKRAVMEALTAILRGGLRVGVLLHGKKVKDDNKTLMQTGISHHNQLDAIGFSLEPNHPPPSASLHHRDSLFLLPCEGPQPLSRHCPTSVVLHPGTCATSAEPHAANSGNLVESDHDSTPHAANSGNLVESDHDSTPSATDMSVDNSTTNVKALATVPAMNVNALAVVPAHRKPKGSEIARRRIRRPFSGAEVEALVQAVEKLGTGRWRDVKLQAFDDAKHRTYVDLKDKWKTLVHTARISPQQRRGEPVPQELLDRALTAHAYWSQQQAKEQLKHQLSETCLLL